MYRSTTPERRESHMQPLDIDYTIYVATSRERLWEGLTAADFTRRYWAEEIRSDWTIGSAVTGGRVRVPPAGRWSVAWLSGEDMVVETWRDPVRGPVEHASGITSRHQPLEGRRATPAGRGQQLQLGRRAHFIHRDHYSNRPGRRRTARPRAGRLERVSSHSIRCEEHLPAGNLGQ